jgi:hypothetical protein
MSIIIKLNDSTFINLDRVTIIKAVDGLPNFTWIMVTHGKPLQIDMPVALVMEACGR